jgi:MFS family permease
MIGASLLLGTPFFIVFGTLSDKIGRKPIIMAGCLIAALTFFPLFKALTHNVNPAIESFSASTPLRSSASVPMSWSPMIQVPAVRWSVSASSRPTTSPA